MTPTAEEFCVTYMGFLGPVFRAFDSEARARQWARQSGRYRECLIYRDVEPPVVLKAKGEQ